MSGALALLAFLAAAPAGGATPESLRAGADQGLLRLRDQRPAPAKPTPLRTIPLAEIRAADDRTFLQVETAAGEVSAGIAFGAGYEQFLRLRGPGPAVAFPWKGLGTGADWGGLRVETDASAARFCPTAGVCATVAADGLLARAYEEGLRVEVPAVLYSLTLSPDGAVLTMLRRDGAGMYWIGSHPFAALRAGPVWFVAVDGMMFGFHLKGDALALVSKPVPPAR